MAKVYFAGLPTDIDVRAIIEKWGVPSEGVPISYEEIAALIKVPVASCRFKTVTGAWRRRLRREHDIYLLARHGAFTVRDPVQRVEFGSLKIRTGARAFRTAVKVVVTTDRKRLSNQHLAEADHVLLVGGLVQAHGVLAAKRVQPALPEGVKAP